MRKIIDFDEKENDAWVHQVERCFHPEHNPPNMMVLQPGVYEHICPGCGITQYVTVQPKHKLLHV